MLELRPNCELCDKDLPPDSLEARICSYEFTYCADCVDTLLFQCLRNLRRRLECPADPPQKFLAGKSRAWFIGAPCIANASLFKFFTRFEIEEMVEKLRAFNPRER